MSLKLIVYKPEVDPDLLTQQPIDQYTLFAGGNIFAPISYESIQQSAIFQNLVKLGAIEVSDYTEDSKLTTDDKSSTTKKK